MPDEFDPADVFDETADVEPDENPDVEPEDEPDVEPEDEPEDEPTEGVDEPAAGPYPLGASVVYEGAVYKVKFRRDLGRVVLSDGREVYERELQPA